MGRILLVCVAPMGFADKAEVLSRPGEAASGWPFSGVETAKLVQV